VLANYVGAMGSPGRNVAGSVVALVVNLVMNVALIPVWGIEGAALASTLSYGLTLFSRLLTYRTFDSSDASLTGFLVPRISDLALLGEALRPDSAEGRSVATYR
jgi:O-antigen/teichoic acid export membrane protein